MRRWKVYARSYLGHDELEVGRFWTRAGAERWALAHQDRLLDLWRIDTKRREQS
jgi:hypothetical protein